MPPRKSTSSIPPMDNEEIASPTSAAVGAQMTEQQIKAQSDGVSVEDLLLPRSVTQRLAKSVLPPDTAIQKDALLAIQKAATVFVSYLASHANESTLKRTLAPADVLAALSELEFDSLRPQLERELDAHTEALADKKRVLKEKKTATTSETQTDSKDAEKESTSLHAEDGEKKKDKSAKVTSASIKGHKRIKRDGNGDAKTGVSPDETEVEEPDEDETEEEEEEVDEEEEVEDEEENEEVDENETQSAEDLDRVEDLDARMQADDDESGSDEDDDGPAAQLRSNMGLG